MEKPRNKWSKKELDAYKIVIKNLDVPNFFGMQTLPNPSGDEFEELFTKQSSEEMTYPENTEFIGTLSMMTCPELNGNVSQFSVLLFRRMRYPKRCHGKPEVMFWRMKVDLMLSNTKRPIEVSACIHNIKNNIYSFPVVGDRFHGLQRAIPRLILCAIAMFQHQNNILEKQGREPLKELVRCLIGQLVTHLNSSIHFE